MTYRIEVEMETEGRWIAEVLEMPGAMVYADRRGDAIARVMTLTLRVLVEKREHGEARL